MNTTQIMIQFVELGLNSARKLSEQKTTPRRVRGKKKKIEQKKKEKTTFELASDLAQEKLKPMKKVILKSLTKKKEKKKGIICKYCKHFYEAEKRRLERDNATLIDFRQCKKIKKEVTDLEEGCEDFELNNTFWCDSLDCWINIKACESRNKKEEEGCIRCRQGRKIRELNNGTI